MSKMRQWSLMTAVAVLVVFVGGWFLLVKPQKSKVADLKTQTVSQNSTNQTIITKIAALQSEERQLPAQQLALQKFSTEVPDTASEPTLIRQLSAAAQGAGVNLISMTPGTAQAMSSGTTTPGATTPGATSLANPGSGSVTELPISLGVVGSYANLESFFQSLEKLPRALLVNGWDMCQVAATGSAAASSAPAAGGGCTTPTLPSNVNPPTGTLGATLTADVFYAAPPATTQTAGTTATGSTSTATGSSTTTSPSTAPTTAASTAASTPATSATTS